jgi:hypothetical protein
MKMQQPAMTDKAVADAVGCDPSTLSGSREYRAVRDAVAVEAAKKFSRSRRNRGRDMDEYSDNPDR